jgi:hypothetical protein
LRAGKNPPMTTPPVASARFDFTSDSRRMAQGRNSAMCRWATRIISAFAILWLAGQARAATPINACGTVITTSGSYVVKKDLTPKGGGNCITVVTDYVTIDLGGFTINCASESGLGIADNGDYKGMIIRNGIITGCQDGIFLQSQGVLIEGINGCQLLNDRRCERNLVTQSGKYGGPQPQ